VLTKMDVIDRIIKESTMDQSLIAQKLRELADLFDQQVTPKAEPKAVKETRTIAGPNFFK